MEKIPNEYYIILVQYNQEENFHLFHVCDNLLDAIYYKKYCQKKAKENHFNEIYKIFTYKLQESLSGYKKIQRNVKNA